MTRDQAIAVLRKHNEWRRHLGDDTESAPKMQDPSHVGFAIDAVVKMAAAHETAMNVLRQIASRKRRTMEQRLAQSCVSFLDALEEG